MKRIIAFENIVKVIATAIGVILANQVARTLDAQQVPPLLTIIVQLVVVGITFVISREGVSYLIDSSQWLRRMIARDQFVEGTWINIIHEPESFIAIISLKFERGEIRISGQDYHSDGTIFGMFKTEMVSVDWPVIRYKYVWSRNDERQPHIHGYGEIWFTENDTSPNRGSGFFVNIDERRYRKNLYLEHNKETLEKIDNHYAVKEVVKSIVEKEPKVFAKPK